MSGISPLQSAEVLGTLGFSHIQLVARATPSSRFLQQAMASDTQQPRLRELWGRSPLPHGLSPHSRTGQHSTKDLMPPHPRRYVGSVSEGTLCSPAWAPYSLSPFLFPSWAAAWKLLPSTNAVKVKSTWCVTFSQGSQLRTVYNAMPDNSCFSYVIQVSTYSRQKSNSFGNSSFMVEAKVN